VSSTLLSTLDDENAKSGDLPVFDAKPLLLQGSGQNPFSDEMPWQGRGLHAFFGLEEPKSEGVGEGAEIENRVFPSVFECFWVL
jgi:hypothetical protein